MHVTCYGSNIEIPDLLIDKYARDFECLSGKGMYMEVNQLRSSIGEIVDIISEEPDLLHEYEYRSDFIKALAMKKAMELHGIYYDA